MKIGLGNITSMLEIKMHVQHCLEILGKMTFSVAQTVIQMAGLISWMLSQQTLITTLIQMVMK